MQFQRKKARERILLDRLLEYLGEDSGASFVEEGERPDFIIEDASGRRVGLEITELLSHDQGRDRAADNRVAVAIKRAVGWFLRERGGSGGGIIDGSTVILPSREPARLEEAISKHLVDHGAPLMKDRGVLSVPFRHAWGEILHVERLDSHADVLLLEADHNQPLAYKRPRPVSHLEAALLDAIQRKIAKARSYRKDVECWLAMRNPNEPLRGVRQEVRENIRNMSRGLFSRVLVFNLQQDVLSNRLRQPPYLDLLT